MIKSKPAMAYLINIEKKKGKQKFILHFER